VRCEKLAAEAAWQPRGEEGPQLQTTINKRLVNSEKALCSHAVSVIFGVCKQRDGSSYL
jgi:hypothetical protein